MTGLETGLPFALRTAGGLVGFLLSLLIFSYVLRDNRMARAAQFLLVGVSLGYLTLLTWTSVLWPRLFGPAAQASSAPLIPAFADQSALFMRWIPLGLGLLLWLAGADAFRRADTPQIWLRALAILPLAILVGVGLGVGVAGALQGSLGPQLERAIALGRLVSDSNELLIIGLLTLAVTGGALIRLHVLDDSERQPPLPEPLLALLQGWGWIGQRALWLAAGVIFARLFASRMTLLIARLHALLNEPALQEALRMLTGRLGGG